MIPKTINVSEDVKVWEYESESPHSKVTLNIPFTVDLVGIRPLSEYKEISLEDIHLKINTVFEIIESFGEDIRAGEYSRQGLMDINEFTLLLSVIGKGLNDAVEIVKLSFDRYEKTQKELEKTEK